MRAGWRYQSLGDVCDVVNGGTPKTGVNEYWGGPHLWITPAEMGRRPTPYVSDTERKITELGLRDSSARLLPSGSVILSSRAPIGHLMINTLPMATNQGCKGLVPRDGLDAKYLYYFLSSIVDLLNDLGSGATFKELSGGKLKEVQIPVAPAAVQKRIVAILDEAFEGIATAKANAEAGRLLANEVLSTAKRNGFAELLAAYSTTELGDVCDFENGDRGKNYPGKQHRVSVGIPFINAGHLTEDGIDYSSMDYISPERFDLLGNGKVRPNDILFCLRGSLGKFSSVGGLNKAAIASSLVIIRPKQGLDADYLLSYLSSALCAEQIDRFKGGAAQPNLGAKDLKRFELPFPPANVQREFANQMLELESRARQLADAYAAKLYALDDLKKSLLHHAFSGQL